MLRTGTGPPHMWVRSGDQRVPIAASSTRQSDCMGTRRTPRLRLPCPLPARRSSAASLHAWVSVCSSERRHATVRMHTRISNDIHIQARRRAWGRRGGERRGCGKGEKSGMHSTTITRATAHTQMHTIE